MPIYNSKTGKIVKSYSIEELKDIAKEMRSYAIIAITAATSGHTGGSMSVADMATVLYFKKIKHDPKNPQWEYRDRVFWSAGHKAPALYAALGLSGYFNIDDIVNLRKLSSGFEGHPNRFKLPGIEVSSGSLGQGLGIAIGSALNAKLEKKEYTTYCILGDGELNEGSIWEAAMSAAHYKIDNLCALLDYYGLQIDGPVKKIMDINPLSDKWRSFGWHVFEVDGHDMEAILDALHKAEKIKGKPSIIICKTIKGKGVSFFENKVEYHGVAPTDEELERALKEL